MGELPRFSAFLDTKHPLFEDRAHAEVTLRNCIRDHLVLVAVKGEEPVGFILGVVLRHPFNPRIRTLSEQLWWVKESARRSPAAKQLLDAFMSWGKAHVDWVTFGLGRKTKVRPASLAKRGLRPFEAIYLWEGDR